MIFTYDKEERWKLFEHYATRMLMKDKEFALSRSEYSDFLFLKLYFAEDYLKARLRPWIPSFLTERAK